MDTKLEKTMLTEQQFDAKLTHIEEQASAMQERVDAYRDQQMAKLFIESDWSQEQLARHLARRWGKEVSRQWITCRLRFGRFISFFATTGSKEQPWKLPRNLTERRFRGYWERTTAQVESRGHKSQTMAAVEDEKRRFAEVLELMQDNSELHRNPKAVKAALLKGAVGKGFKTVGELCELIADDLPGDLLAEDVVNSLSRWKITAKSPYRLEIAMTKSGKKYKIVPIKGAVLETKTIKKWAPELIPLLEVLIAECKKPRVTVDTVTLSVTAQKIEKILGEISVSDAKDE
jgi:hypothetical protein